MIKIPSVSDLLKSAVHIGHNTAKYHPKMSDYITGTKNTIHIIDLEKTEEKLKQALDFVAKAAKQGKNFLFVGTKPLARDIIVKHAKELKIPYIDQRWLGGTFTNFPTIHKLIKKFNTMKQDKQAGKWEKYTKKERYEMLKGLDRMKAKIEGISSLEQRPDVIYIVDIVREKIALKEATKLKIPIIAIVDTNANPELVDFPIPANDDAIKSVELITGLITETIKQNKTK
ncbi:30S ribosomal protein S2 [Patescibacteria group bacterium]|nr:30S ribosomal protein S2 [Patescibacteria group bacterium]